MFLTRFNNALFSPTHYRSFRYLCTLNKLNSESPTLNIAICGAGISGLTLAGILSKHSKLRGIPMNIDLFERAEMDRDQGYGLDLDEVGQEALVLAGVYNRYWEIARPKSDSYAFYSTQPTKNKPFLTLCFPKFMRFPARPECNRTALRQILIDEINKDKICNIHFETASRDLCYDEKSKKVQLIGDDEHILGDYDLIVDAMGLHSTLRLFRVNDEISKHYDGKILIHGAINDPESKWSKGLLDRFDTHGTMMIFGKDFDFGVQRYGAKDNNQTAFFLRVKRDDEYTVHKEADIPISTSRKDGILMDDATLNRLKNWILTECIDGTKYLDPLWIELIQSLDRMTVRAQYTHGDDVTFKETEVPIVCIGDSLRNCGIGGGGMLAMKDAIELAKILIEGKGKIDWKNIKKLEVEMLKGKIEFNEKWKSNAKVFRADDDDLNAVRGKDEDPYISVKQAAKRLCESSDGKDASIMKRGINSLKFGVVYALCHVIGPISNAVYRFDQKIGGGGSTKDSPIYKNVKQAMKEMEEFERKYQASETSLEDARKVKA